MADNLVRLRATLSRVTFVVTSVGPFSLFFEEPEEFGSLADAETRAAEWARRGATCTVLRQTVVSIFVPGPSCVLRGGE